MLFSTRIKTPTKIAGVRKVQLRVHRLIGNTSACLPLQPTAAPTAVYRPGMLADADDGAVYPSEGGLWFLSLAASLKLSAVSLP